VNDNSTQEKRSLCPSSNTNRSIGYRCDVWRRIEKLDL
jgi:hypothetical protein